MKKGYSRASQNSLKSLMRICSYMKYHPWMVIFGFLGLLLNVFAVVLFNAFTGKVIDSIAVQHSWSLFLVYLVQLGILSVLAVVGQFLNSFLLGRLAYRLVFRIREELIQKIYHLPVNYFDTHSHGEIMSTFTNDVTLLQQMLEQGLFSIFSLSIQFIGFLSVMTLLSWKLTIITLIFMVVTFYSLNLITKISSSSYKARQQHTAMVNGYVEEMIGAQNVVKIFDYEKRSIEGFNKKAEELKHSSTKAAAFGVMAYPFVGNMGYIMYSVISMVGAMFVIGGQMTLGSVVSYIQYTRSIGNPLGQIASQLNIIFAGLAGAERIFGVLDMTEEVMSGEVHIKNSEEDSSKMYWEVPQSNGENKLIPVCGDIEFHNVDFSYVTGKPVLKNINLYARPGQKIALVGSTGAGKTTITNLINRFYDIEGGTITVDGIDIRLIDKYSLRSILSVVLQDVNLFEGTIAENIRFGNLKAEDMDVVEAAMSANAHKFISRLDHGYETKIGNGGYALSQGERQLLSIARAAIANPVVLIMDEATSSVDTRTERLISEGMDKLMEGRTTFVIAHRLSTVRNADVILVMEHGEIVERGNHDELMALKGRYYDLNMGNAKLD